MAMPFIGLATHKVDAKGRVSLPSNFRRVAQDGDPSCEDKKKGKCTIILIHGWKEGCLIGYSIASYQDLCDMVYDLEEDEDRDEQLIDIVFSNADYVEVDEAGRMGLKDMRKFLGEGEEISFVGRADRFEIWAPDDYERQRASRAATGGDPTRRLRRRRRRADD